MNNRVPIKGRGIVVLNALKESFDFYEIQNRRFLYNPKTGTLVLGKETTKIYQPEESHAMELHESGVEEPFDDFARGWVGCGIRYGAGIIHFSPWCESTEDPIFTRAFDTVEMFWRNGADDETVIRGLGGVWERKMPELFPSRDGQ